MGIVKIALAVLLLPIVWASGVGFYDYINTFPGVYGEYFTWGLYAYLLFFIFFYQFSGLHEFGQKIIFKGFRFAPFVSRFMAQIIPFYTVAILLLYYVSLNFFEFKNFDYHFMFFTGFALSMHIVMTARNLQGEERSFLKIDYLTMMVPAFVLTLFITVLLFNLVFQKFLFPDFLQAVWSRAWGIYSLLGR